MSDDVAKLGLGILVAAAAALGVWAWRDRRARAAGSRTQTLRIPLAWHVLIAVLAVTVFAVIAEDVLTREQGQLILELDTAVRNELRPLRSQPAVRAAATWVSRLTGEGLVVGVLATGAWLVVVRRRRDALVIVAGSLGAWVANAAMKITFQVPRPGAPRTDYAISGYGFPSGHTAVAVAACGLVAWALSRGASPRGRAALYSCAAVVALLGGASRVMLNAHWLSDVLAGFAVGVLWLDLVILSASWSTRATPARAV